MAWNPAADVYPLRLSKPASILALHRVLFRLRVPVAVTLVALIGLLPVPALAGTPTVRVAVASSFSGTLAEIANSFSADSGIRVESVVGSTGALFAQIKNGAPVDVYLAADNVHPVKLWQSTGKRLMPPFIYAQGRLVLWGRQLGDVENGNALLTGQLQSLAIADPAVAPYGVAALQVFDRADIGHLYSDSLIYGGNVAQALQFAAIGGASAALVSTFQLPGNGHSWLVPEHLYDPVIQQGIALNDRSETLMFVKFLLENPVGEQ